MPHPNHPKPNSLADIDSFITMLRVACEDETVYARLEKILTLPDQQRRGILASLIADMRGKGAPAEFIRAFECLTDNRIAEKAYETIFRCRRKSGFFDFFN
jgi:hypothetical protein